MVIDVPEDGSCTDSLDGDPVNFCPSTEVVARVVEDRLAAPGLPRLSTVAIPGRPWADLAALGDTAAVTGRPAGKGDAINVLTGGLK